MHALQLGCGRRPIEQEWRGSDDATSNHIYLTLAVGIAPKERCFLTFGGAAVFNGVHSSQRVAQRPTCSVAHARWRARLRDINVADRY